MSDDDPLLPQPAPRAAARRKDDAGNAQPPLDLTGSGRGGGGSPGVVASAFRHVFGHVDPETWGAKGAAAGGLSGAFVGGLAGGAGEGTLGALAGTAVEPVGGTLIGGIAGATDGAMRGAVVGGLAGAALLGTAAKLAGVLVSAMEGNTDGADDGTEQSPHPPQTSAGGPANDPPSAVPASPPPEVSSQEIAAFRRRINVPETNTIGVGRTNVPGLEGRTFEGASSVPRREAGLPSTGEGPITSPNPSPRFRGHAEQDIANQFVEAVEQAGVRGEDMRGREFLMRIQNEDGVCTICRQGLRNPNVPAGVLKQLSEHYPDLRIRVVVDNPGPNLVGEADFTLLNGTYAP